MLGFVREFLEGFVIEGEEGFGEPHPLEEFGGIVLFVQIVVARYDVRPPYCTQCIELTCTNS